jgi:membrane protein required for colicin V production|tara:strand:+ start:525 stop:1073 length:549 start_codon:yes stop_codon:yes gene_type:complete
MLQSFFEHITNGMNWFDGVFIVIIAFSVFQCFLKGFSLSFISFMKYVLSVVITIILVPKLQPWISEYVESEFINNVGLGVFVFIFSLFTLIIIGRSLGRAVTWTGLGSIDKTFGLFFGLFKGYVISVCLFSILTWFYPYDKWGISVEKALTFDIVKKGSDVLIKEFPSNKEFIDTKEKIEKI